MSRRHHQNPVRPRGLPSSNVPLWFSAASYYSFSAAIATALFFILWGAFIDSGDENPWIAAGIVASLAFAGFVVIREVFIRRRVKRLVADRARLDHTIRRAAAVTGPATPRRKITISTNNEIIAHIKLKSEAAKILGDIGQTHREVFELCDQYLSDVAEELLSVSPGSPRIAAFRTGKATIRRIHKFHVLKWAEIESKQIAPAGYPRANISENLVFAARAADVLNVALEYYPDDERLIGSAEVVDDILTKARAAELVQSAENMVADGELSRAIDLYNEALVLLNRGDRTAWAESMRADVLDKIDSLESIERP